MIHNMDEWLKNIIAEFKKNREFRREFPELGMEIGKYIKLLEKYKKSISNPKESYDYVVQLDKTGKYYYTCSWDAQLLRELLKGKNEYRSVSYSSELYLFINIEELDEGELNNDGEYIPAIVGQFAPTNEIIIIDGKYQITREYLKDPYKELDVYYLPADGLTLGMSGELCEVCYKIHHNIEVIRNYCLGNISYPEYGDHFHNNELFPFESEMEEKTPEQELPLPIEEDLVETKLSLWDKAKNYFSKKI